MSELLDLWFDIEDDEVNYEKPSKGLSDSIFMTDNYVFKSGSDSSIYKNMRLNELARENGVNTPRVLLCSRKHDVVVYERINGSMLSEIERSIPEKVAFKIGKQLKLMHSNNYRGFGDISTVDGVNGKHETYADFVDQFVNSANKIDQDSLFRDLVDRCSEIIHSNEIPDRTQSSLLHLDYHSQNVIVQNSDVYVIDFENGDLGPYEMDFVHSYIMLQREMGDKFCENYTKGYGKKISDLNEIGICVGILKEVRAARWWEKNSSKDLRKRKNTIEEFFDRFLN